MAHRAFSVATMGILALVGGVDAARGAVILTAGGWQASVPDALAGDVSLFVDVESFANNVLVIEKFATFRSLSPIDITFTRISPTAPVITRIAIAEEAITNVSGAAWTSFDISLIDGTGVTSAFNAGLSGGFDPDDFATFTVVGPQLARFSNGTVANNSTWLPGQGPGNLVVDVTLAGGTAGQSFTLRELPVPTPGSAALAVIAGVMAARRRRSN